jgi:hypothetical protein
MNTGRDTFSQRRAIESGAYTLLVHRMAGLVQRREYCIAKVVLVDVSGDAYVAGRKARAERMMGQVKPAAVKNRTLGAERHSWQILAELLSERLAAGCSRQRQVARRSKIPSGQAGS